MENVAKDGGEVYAEFHAQSLMGGRRAIVVQGADNNLTPMLKKMLPETPSENLLILSSSVYNTKSALITWAKERRDILTVGCYEDREGDIMQEAAAMLREKGLVADNATLQVLCARLSPDKRINQSEIDKLEMYLGERKSVTIADVQNAVCDTAGASTEDLCYFVAGGEIKKALNIFNRLLKEGEEPASLVRSVEYHFANLLESTAKIANGQTVDAATASLRLMFYRKPEFLKQLRMWNKEHLLSALSMLYECERDCKSNNIPADEVAGYTFLRLAKFGAKLRQTYG
jgi:DNA polymerase-3 subunit delta